MSEALLSILFWSMLWIKYTCVSNRFIYIYIYCTMHIYIHAYRCNLEHGFAPDVRLGGMIPGLHQIHKQKRWGVFTLSPESVRSSITLEHGWHTTHGNSPSEVFFRRVFWNFYFVFWLCCQAWEPWNHLVFTRSRNGRGGGSWCWVLKAGFFSFFFCRKML